MNVWGWTPAGPSPQGTNRHMDGERHRRQGTVEGQSGEGSSSQFIVQSHINGSPGSCMPAFWWPAQCQEAPGWAAEGHQCGEEMGSLALAVHVTAGILLTQQYHPHFHHSSLLTSPLLCQRVRSVHSGLKQCKGRGNGQLLWTFWRAEEKGPPCSGIVARHK